MTKTERKVIFLRVAPSIKAALMERAHTEGRTLQETVMAILMERLSTDSDVTDEEIASEG